MVIFVFKGHFFNYLGRENVTTLAWREVKFKIAYLVIWLQTISVNVLRESYQELHSPRGWENSPLYINKVFHPVLECDVR